MAVVEVPSDFFFERGRAYKPGEILLKLLRPAKWMDKARCADMPLSVTDPLFFPSKSGSHPESVKNLARARGICAGCEVRLDCLEFALDVEGRPYMDTQPGKWGNLRTKRTTPEGIYGGIKPEERRAIMRKPRKEQLQILDEIWKAAPKG